jgi:hypothetical protein
MGVFSAFQPPPPGRRSRRRAGQGACLLAAFGLLAGPAAALAAPRCADQSEQSVFEVEALKSELMVVGITCKQEERYNAFMQRYQPRLAENYRAFEQHFSRTRGRAGKSATDAYITNLAQTRGFEAQKLGSDFCLRNPGLFDEVMALPSAAELPAYAAGKDLIPESLGACATPAAAPARRAASSNRSRGR